MHYTKLQYLRRHWLSYSWSVIKTFVAWFSVVMTSFITLRNLSELSGLTLLYNALSQAIEFPWTLPSVALLVLIIVAIVRFPTIRCSYTDPQTHIRVIIECCDLLHQDGLKVIHSVDTFDTALGTIITPRSLHGAFLALCQQKKVDIDALIEPALSRLPIESTDDSLPGRKNRYALGTICPILLPDKKKKANSSTFALVSFARMQTNGSISIHRQEYTDFLHRMWTNLANPTVRQEELNVAIIGNRFIDLPADFTTEQKIDIMVQSFFAVARERKICNTLRICVHDSNALDVDFAHYPTVLEHLAKRPNDLL